MFKYCSNPDTSEPIMLLNKQIGMTCNQEGAWDGEPYIDGAEFQEELMLLDSMGKKRIQIWIVSPGGSVIQAMNIYSAILKSVTPVDTYNGGLCGSSAGLIFMAGRKRGMADYAQLMMHPVSGEDDNKMYEAFMEMCTRMLSPKSGQTGETIRAMLDAETWLNAEQCLELGMCTEIEYTTNSNTKYMPQGSTAENVKALMSYSNTFLNSKINITMKKVTNKLGLVEGSNEDAICEALEKMKSTQNLLASEKEALQAQLDEATAAKETAQATIDTLTAELATAAEMISEQTEAANELAATDVVNSFKNRIGDKPEVLARWVNLAKADMTGTKAMLEALPINSLAPAVKTGNVGQGKATKNVSNIMHEIKLKTQNK